MTAAKVMIRLFFRSVRKLSAWIAEVKLLKVGWCGQKYGVNVRISLAGLNAVLIIQYTGNAIARAKATPTRLYRTVAPRLRPAMTVSRPRAARRAAREH